LERNQHQSALKFKPALEIDTTNGAGCFRTKRSIRRRFGLSKSAISVPLKFPDEKCEYFQQMLDNSGFFQWRKPLGFIFRKYGPSIATRERQPILVEGTAREEL
jgi:hypothetical protein